jgi:hypothetical protein
VRRVGGPPEILHTYLCAVRHLLRATQRLSSRAPRQISPTVAAHLPNEILSAIFEGLSQSTLTRLARVCPSWRATAERLLYASVIIRENLPSLPPHVNPNLAPPIVPWVTLRCCETLDVRPHLAVVVRRFHLRWAAEHMRTPGRLLNVAQDIIQILLPRLVHLESLELSFGLGAFRDQPPLANLLGTCALPCLRALALSGMCGTPEPVLQRNPGLLHLKLPDYAAPLRLQPNDLLGLISFHGTPAAAASLLPGRSVSTLGLVGHEFVTEADLARMARAPVSVLDLSRMNVTFVLLRDVSCYMAGITVLRMRLALRHTLHYALPGIVRPACHVPARARSCNTDGTHVPAATHGFDVGALRIPFTAHARPRPHEHRGRCGHGFGGGRESAVYGMVRGVPDAPPCHLPVQNGVDVLGGQKLDANLGSSDHYRGELRLKGGLSSGFSIWLSFATKRGGTCGLNEQIIRTRLVLSIIIVGKNSEWVTHDFRVNKKGPAIERRIGKVMWYIMRKRSVNGEIRNAVPEEA